MTYAVHASAEFNMGLGESMGRLSDEIKNCLKDNLIALVLGGGYGRGEGGVVCHSGKEEPYNDLDLVIVIKRKKGLPWKKLSTICRRYQALLGIHVDLSRPLTIRDIRHWPQALMWQDLLNGHIVLTGPNNIILDNAPAHLTAPLPPGEGLRLLLNRGAGLLWATRVCRGLEPEPDHDFVRRNYYKCALSLGDALLICHECFVSSYTERGAAFQKLSDTQPEVARLDLGSLYADALTFKFRPDRIPADTPPEGALAEVAKAWGQVLLHVERKRTGQSWESVGGYTQWTGLREPVQSDFKQWPRNIMRNLKVGQCSCRHPRERLYRTLPGLLGLCGAEANWAERTEQWLRVWRHFD